jgi:hypothetical protein
MVVFLGVMVLGPAVAFFVLAVAFGAYNPLRWGRGARSAARWLQRGARNKPRGSRPQPMCRPTGKSNPFADLIPQQSAKDAAPGEMY